MFSETALLTWAQVGILADAYQAVVTATGAIVAAGWAYFTFIKDRTYNPHLEVGLNGQWRTQQAGRPLFHARITVKNIGKSKVDLDPSKNSLIVYTFGHPGYDKPIQVMWDRAGGWPVIAEHAWIEPGETVADDLLLDLCATTPVAVKLEAQIAGNWLAHNHTATFFARRVVGANAQLDDTVKAATEAAAAADDDWVHQLSRWLADVRH